MDQFDSPEQKQELVRLIESPNKDEVTGEKIYQFVKHIKFLSHLLDDYSKEYNIHFVFQLCNNLKFESFAKGEVVFQQNDTSNNKLYVILDGRVIIQKKEDLDQIIAIRDNKTLPPTPSNLSMRPKLPDIKSATNPRNFPHPHSERSDPLKFTNVSSLRPPSKDLEDNCSETEDIDGEILIDHSHTEPFGQHKTKTREGFTALGVSNQRKTGSFQNLESWNSAMNGINPLSPENSKVKANEIEALRKWSILLSSYLAKVVKKPFKILKSEIISPWALESLIKTHGNILRIMEKGDAVGEKALMENNPRSATVCTITPCEFLILKKKDLKHAKDQFEGVLIRRSDFLLEALKLNQQTFSSKIKENMLYSFSVEKHKKGQLLTTQGKSDVRFFLIEKGEVLIEKTVNMRKSIKGFSKKEFESVNPHNFTLCVSVTGNFVGEEIIFSESNQYEYSAKVFSNECSVLVVNKHIFFTKFPMEIRQVLYQGFQNKVMNRRRQIEQLIAQFHAENKGGNTASEIFYSRGVNVFTLLQKSCYKSFHTSLKRTVKTDIAEEKDLKNASPNRSISEVSNKSKDRAKYAKYFIGPRSKCKYIKNTISFPKYLKVFNLENPDKEQKKKTRGHSYSRKVQLLPLRKEHSLNPYEGLDPEKIVIRKGEANQPMIDVDILLGHSEDYIKRTFAGKIIKKLDFGEEDEVRFKYFDSKNLTHDYLRSSHKNFDYGQSIKKISTGVYHSRLNKSEEGEGVFVNYSKEAKMGLLDKNQRNETIDYEDLNNMNSTYNFSTMKRNGFSRTKSMAKEKETDGENSKKQKILRKSMQCLKIEKDNRFREKPADKVGPRMHEKWENCMHDLRFPANKMHDLRLVRKCREKKQRSQRGVLV